MLPLVCGVQVSSGSVTVTVLVSVSLPPFMSETVTSREYVPPTIQVFARLLELSFTEPSLVFQCHARVSPTSVALVA